jgi:hypothetical protein
MLDFSTPAVEPSVENENDLGEMFNSVSKLLNVPSTLNE